MTLENIGSEQNGFRSWEMAGAPVAYPLIQWHQGQKRSFLRLGEQIPLKWREMARSQEKIS